MYINKTHLLKRIFLTATTLILLMSGLLNNHTNELNSNIFTARQVNADDNNVYLPFINKPIIPIFGVESNLLHSSWLQEKAKEANVYWTRNFAISWKDIEPIRTDPPTYHWEEVDETTLINANANGLKIIAVVKLTPDWAQKYPGYSCGPVAEAHLDEFAEFMQAVVERYSRSPYDIKYWEIGNEPDIDYRLPDDPNSIYGCWGDQDDNYYGGGYYAEALSHIYPAIKTADPNSKVLIGGLLLDCNPDNPPPNSNCLPGRFFEGILDHNGAGDGANYFDIVSFHAYPYYYGGNDHGALYQDENNIKWGVSYTSTYTITRGIVLGKLDFLRLKMQAAGIDKPIMQTEGSLLFYCKEINQAECPTPPDDFFEKQADYVVWLYIRNWAEGILGTTWYTLEGRGWQNGGLLDGSQQPRPAYYALKFLSEELNGAKFSGKITDNPDVRGFDFRKSNKHVWVLWSPDEQDHLFQLPASYNNTNTIIYDKYGNSISWTPSEITVNSPIYVEHTH